MKRGSKFIIFLFSLAVVITPSRETKAGDVCAPQELSGQPAANQICSGVCKPGIWKGQWSGTSTMSCGSNNQAGSVCGCPCTTVTIDYFNADWYADAWLTKCDEKDETTFYASYNTNTVDIKTGSRIRIGRTGTSAKYDFIDTYPQGSTFYVQCSGGYDENSSRYGPPHCDILSGGMNKSSQSPVKKPSANKQ